jgi:invasion protein IalB
LGRYESRKRKKGGRWMVTLTKEDMEALREGKSVTIYVEDENGREIEAEIDSEWRK